MTALVFLGIFWIILLGLCFDQEYEHRRETYLSETRQPVKRTGKHLRLVK